jgi:hypothetical protein
MWYRCVSSVEILKNRVWDGLNKVWCKTREKYRRIPMPWFIGSLVIGSFAKRGIQRCHLHTCTFTHLHIEELNCQPVTDIYRKTD